MTSAVSVRNHPSELADSIQRPPLLLAVLCVLLPLLPLNIVLAGPLKGLGSPARAIALAMACLTVLGFLLTTRSSNRTTMNPAAVMFTIFFSIQFLILGIGSIRMASPLAEESKDRMLFVLIGYAGVALYTSVRVSSPRAVEILLGCLAVSLTLNAAIGIIQIVADTDLRYFLQPPGFVKNDSITATGGNLEGEMSDRFGVLRAVGTSGHPIEFSVISAIAVPLTLHFARFAKTSRVRRLAWIAAPITFGGVIVGVSRSGLLALAAGIFLYMFTLKIRQLALILIAGALALLGASFFVAKSTEALWQTITNSAEDDSVQVRIAALKIVSDIFHSNPWFGIGLGGTSNFETGHLDNQWLQHIAQGGVAGFLSLAILFSGAIFGISAALRCAATPRERDQALTMGAMMLGLTASSYTYDMFAFPQVTTIFLMLYALLWSRFRVPIPSLHRSDEPPGGRPVIRA